MSARTAGRYSHPMGCTNVSSMQAGRQTKSRVRFSGLKAKGVVRCYMITALIHTLFAHMGFLHSGSLCPVICAKICVAEAMFSMIRVLPELNFQRLLTWHLMKKE